MQNTYNQSLLEPLSSPLVVFVSVLLYLGDKTQEYFIHRKGKCNQFLRPTLRLSCHPSASLEFGMHYHFWSADGSSVTEGISNSGQPLIYCSAYSIHLFCSLFSGWDGKHLLAISRKPPGTKSTTYSVCFLTAIPSPLCTCRGALQQALELCRLLDR